MRASHHRHVSCCFDSSRVLFLAPSPQNTKHQVNKSPAPAVEGWKPGAAVMSVWDHVPALLVYPCNAKVLKKLTVHRLFCFFTRASSPRVLVAGKKLLCWRYSCCCRRPQVPEEEWTNRRNGCSGTVAKYLSVSGHLNKTSRAHCSHSYAFTYESSSSSVECFRPLGPAGYGQLQYSWSDCCP